MLYALDSPIFRLDAEFSGGVIAKRGSLVDTQQLVPQLQLAIGAEIMVTRNVYQHG